MTERTEGRTSGDAPVRLPDRRLALTFEAFHDTYYRTWLRYTHLQVGDGRVATLIVDTSCAHLAANWPYVLTRASVPAHAWAVLKEHITAWLTAHNRPVALVETASFMTTVSRGLQRSAEPFSLLETEIRLYAAIAALPERQYDAIVLRYALGCPVEQVARLLGVREGMVRSQIRLAKRRLAVALGVAWQPESGE